MTTTEILKSSEKIGQLYPVLVDFNDNIIDGHHRLQADKNWPKMKLNHIKTEKDNLIAQIACNNIRRTTSKREKTRQLTKLAKIFQSEGLQKGQIGKAIQEATGMSHAWVAKYLPMRFKDKAQSIRARRDNNNKQCSLTITPNKQLIQIREYTNTSFSIYTVKKELNNRISKAAKKLETTSEVLVQNMLANMLTRIEKTNNITPQTG